MTRNFNAKLLFEIFLAFVKIGAVTFGGGLAMLPILERELSQKRGWVTQDELLDYYAIGQATPGIIAVNVATFCGHKLQGTFGGIVATLAIVTPSIFVITILAMFINSLDQIPLMQKALTGRRREFELFVFEAFQKNGGEFFWRDFDGDGVRVDFLFQSEHRADNFLRDFAWNCNLCFERFDEKIDEKKFGGQVERKKNERSKHDRTFLHFFLHRTFHDWRRSRRDNDDAANRRGTRLD